jgi:hypothetical protein
MALKVPRSAAQFRLWNPKSSRHKLELTGDLGIETYPTKQGKDCRG